MKKIYIKDLLRIIPGSKLLSGNTDMELSNFCKDTRIIKKNDIYLGIKGEKFDGNLFFSDAFNKGAKAIIVDNPNIDYSKYNDKGVVLVPNTIECIQALAKYKRSLYNIPLVAITGSVGKTTTKDMIAKVLSTKYNVLKTEGNYNNEIGLPLTILNLTDENAMVIEMGMSSMGEISLLSKIAKPTIGVITTIGSSHIEYLGSRENILKAKLEILDGMEEGKLIINNDNDLLHKYYLDNKDNIISVGIKNNSDYMAYDISKDYSTFKVNNIIVNNQYQNEEYILNMLLAYAVGKELDISDDKYQEAINNLVLTSKRLELIENNKEYIIINDAYNASPESMKVSIEYLSRQKSKRKIAVLGDMLELGTFAKEMHESVGNMLTKYNIDILVTVGTLSKHIALGALHSGMEEKNIYSFDNNQECIEFLKEYLKPKDAIIFKASNGMKLYEIIDKIK